MSRTNPETRLQRQIQKVIVKRWPDAVVYKMHGSEFMEAGIPDLLCCIEGRYIAIEVKHPDTSHDVTPIQQAQMDRINRAQGLAFDATSSEEVIERIEEWLD